MGVNKDITESENIKKEIFLNEERFRIAIKSSKMAIFNQDKDLRYTWVYNPNPAYNTENVLHKTDYDLLTPEEANNIILIKKKVLETGIPETKEITAKIDNKTFIYELNIEPLKEKNGDIIGITYTSYDITEYKSSENRIRSLLDEKELILKEVHHRIRNNLQTLQNILSFELTKTNNEQTKVIIESIRNQTTSMVVLYNKLYSGDTSGEVSLNEYLSSLISEIIKAYSFPGKIIKNIDDIVISGRIIFSLGIILNEIITNSLKHAFICAEDGTIEITVKHVNNHISIIIVDNCKGFDINRISRGFGSILINALVEQIHGNLKIEQRNGTICTLEFNIK